MSLPIYNMSGAVCFNCKTPIVKRVSMADGKGSTLVKGTIMICSVCRHPMVLGESSWRPLTREDFRALSKASREKLLVTAKGLEGLMKEGKEWTPYGSLRKSDNGN